MKNQNKLAFLKFLTLAILFTSSIVASFAQQKLEAPQNLRADINDDNLGYNNVTLVWDTPVGDRSSSNNMNYTNIYAGYGSADDSVSLSGYILIGTVDSQKGSENSFELGFLSQGTYTFYVTSSEKIGGVLVESEKSNIITVNVEGNDQFTIYSQNYYYDIAVGDGIKIPVYAYNLKENCDFDVNISFDESAFEIIEEFFDENYTKWFVLKTLKRGTHKLDFEGTNCEGQVSNYTLDIPVGIFYRDLITFQNKGLERFYLQGTDEFLVLDDYLIRNVENLNCPINYRIDFTTFIGASIGEDGRITIPNSPENRGYHTLHLGASIEECNIDGEFINAYAQGYVEIAILDWKLRPNALIKGKVTDKETGEPVSGAIITFISLTDSLNNYPDVFVPNNYFNTSSDVNGQYALDLKDGEYHVSVSGYGYQYYTNMTEYGQDGLIINAEDTLTFDVSLLKEVIPNYVTLTGKVTDEVTGEPIQNAFVNFIPTIYLEKGFFDGVDTVYRDWDNDFGYYFYLSSTDENGNYSISLPDNLKYIAQCIGTQVYETTDEIYSVEYYNETTDIFKAEEIDLTTKELKSIDFTLTVKPLQLGNISGTTVKDNNELLPSTVLAIRVDTYNTSGQSVYTTIARDGEFFFESLPYGKYLLLSVPMTLTHIPGYYVSNDFASLNWNEASIIEINDATIALNYTILHRTLLNDELDGIADFEGRIGKKGTNIKLNDKTQSTNALSGVAVYLVNSKGDVLDYKFTNKDGNFTFNKIPEGEYKLVTDKIGYKHSNTNITISYKNGIKFSGVMEMEADLSLSVEDNNNISDVKVFPMPVVNEATIEINTTNGLHNVSVIDQNGKLINQFNYNFIDGINELKLNTENYSNGTYFMVFNQNTGLKTVKFNVVK